MTQDFNLRKEGWKLVGLQLGIGILVAIICAVVDHFTGRSTGGGLSLLSVILGAMYYAMRIEQKRPGVLEPNIKALSLRAVKYTFFVEAPLLVLALLALSIDEQTGSFVFDWKMLVIVTGAGLLLGLPLAYFFTRLGLSQGLKTMKKAAAAKAAKNPPSIQ